MNNPPYIARRKSSGQFLRYAERYRQAAGACASLLSSTRDPVQRQRLEAKLQKARIQAAFYEAKAQEALDQGE